MLGDDSVLSFSAAAATDMLHRAIVWFELFGSRSMAMTVDSHRVVRYEHKSLIRICWRVVAWMITPLEMSILTLFYGAIV